MFFTAAWAKRLPDDGELSDEEVEKWEHTMQFLADYRAFFPDHDDSLSVMRRIASSAGSLNGPGPAAEKIWKNVFHELESSLPEHIRDVHLQHARTNITPTPIDLASLRLWEEEIDELDDIKRQPLKRIVEIMRYLSETFIRASCHPFDEGWETDSSKASANVGEITKYRMYEQERGVLVRSVFGLEGMARDESDGTPLSALRTPYARAVNNWTISYCERFKKRFDRHMRDFLPAARLVAVAGIVCRIERALPLSDVPVDGAQVHIILKSLLPDLDVTVSPRSDTKQSPAAYHKLITHLDVDQLGVHISSETSLQRWASLLWTEINDHALFQLCELLRSQDTQLMDVHPPTYIRLDRVMHDACEIIKGVWDTYPTIQHVAELAHAHAGMALHTEACLQLSSTDEVGDATSSGEESKSFQDFGRSAVFLTIPSVPPTLASEIKNGLYRHEDDSMGIRNTTLTTKRIADFMGFQCTTVNGEDHPIWFGLRQTFPEAPRPRQHQSIAAVSLLQAIWADDEGECKADPRFDGAVHGVVQLLNDFVGSGKTLQAIMFLTGVAFAHLKLLERPRDVLGGDVTYPPFVYRHRQCFRQPTQASAPNLNPTQSLGMFPRPEIILPGWETRFSATDPSERAAPPNAPILVVVQKTILEQWWRELARTLDSRSLQIVRYRTKSEIESCHRLVRHCSSRRNDKPIVILVESMLVRKQFSRLDLAKTQMPDEALARETRETLFSMNFSTIILDEAHRYRNPPTVDHRAIDALSKLSCLRLLLTATPVINSPMDLANIFKAARHPRALCNDASDYYDWLKDTTSSLERARAVARQYSSIVPDKLSEIFPCAERETYAPAITTTSGSEAISSAIGIDSEVAKVNVEMANEAIKRAEDEMYTSILNRFAGSIVYRSQKSRYFPSGCFDSGGALRQDFTASQTSNILRLPEESSKVLICTPSEEEKLLANMSLNKGCREGPVNRTLPEVKKQLHTAITAHLENHVMGNDQKLELIRKRHLTQACKINDAFLTISRQTTIAPYTTMTGGLFPSDPQVLITSAKVQMAIDICHGILAQDRERGLPPSLQRKIIIYCCWPSHYSYIAYCFAKANLSFATLTGSTSKTQRQGIIDAIQSDNDHEVHCDIKDLPASAIGLAKSRITLISDVGTEGITLTRASVIISLDGHWCPSGLGQFKGRFVRQGQQADVVQFYYLQATDGSDQALNRISSQKERMSRSLGDVVQELSQNRSTELLSYVPGVHEHVQPNASYEYTHVTALPCTPKKRQIPPDNTDTPIITVASLGELANPVMDSDASASMLRSNQTHLAGSPPKSLSVQEERHIKCVREAGFEQFERSLLSWPCIKGDETAESSIAMLSKFLQALRPVMLLPSDDKRYMTKRASNESAPKPDHGVHISSTADVFRYLFKPQETYDSKQQRKLKTAEKRLLNDISTQKMYHQHLLPSAPRPDKRQNRNHPIDNTSTIVQHNAGTEPEMHNIGTPASSDSDVDMDLAAMRDGTANLCKSSHNVTIDRVSRIAATHSERTDAAEIRLSSARASAKLETATKAVKDNPLIDQNIDIGSDVDMEQTSEAMEREEAVELVQNARVSVRGIQGLGNQRVSGSTTILSSENQGSLWILPPPPTMSNPGETQEDVQIGGVGGHVPVHVTRHGNPAEQRERAEIETVRRTHDQNKYVSGERPKENGRHTFIMEGVVPIEKAQNVMVAGVPAQARLQKVSLDCAHHMLHLAKVQFNLQPHTSAIKALESYPMKPHILARHGGPSGSGSSRMAGLAVDRIQKKSAPTIISSHYNREAATKPQRLRKAVQDIPPSLRNYAVFDNKPLILADFEGSPTAWLESRKNIIAWTTLEALKYHKTKATDHLARVHMLRHYMTWLDLKHGYYTHFPSILTHESLQRNPHTLERKVHPLVQVYAKHAMRYPSAADLQKLLDTHLVKPSGLYPLKESVKQTYINRMSLGRAQKQKVQ
ncbi:hypothetical protein QFC21_007314 [Naganishia friedmannii]|uniref:Uncharacterized protein n=1 Tax=Naganishia friedmannii TaxID=89922 RepID=A0ACC2UWJ4_9TREE|nr:hypothetical protein QFC21_007314 [Naganishia friedmannii]